MSDQTFDALLDAYSERGKRVVELEQLCRDMWSRMHECMNMDIRDRMQALGLLEGDTE